MPGELAVVFPRAAVSGGVERVALDLLIFERDRRPTTFVGTDVHLDGIRHQAVRPLRVPRSLGPLAFRRAAASAMSGVDADTVVSMGVDAPPGDVFWVHSVHAAWLSAGGDAFVRGRRVPSTLRRVLPRHQVLLRLEENYFTRHHPRAIICTSPREVDDLVEHYGVDRELTQVVPNGFDATLFAPARRTMLRAEVRSRIGAGADDIVVLMVANEWHRKGLAILLEAVAATKDRRFRVDLVGARSPDQYLAIAARLGLADRLHWHGPSDDVARFHAAADVFALPTTYEPFGLVIIEAMASGLPVITSALAGAAQAITDGVSGTLLDDPRDVDGLSVALLRLSAADRRRDMGGAAAQAARPFARDQVMDRVDSVLFPDERA